jgi:hypothetical protein
MKTRLAFLIVLVALATISTAKCPFTSGEAVEYCIIDIMPQERLYNQELTINVSTGFMREYWPMTENTKLEIWFYNESNEVQIDKFRTDETGIIKYTPTTVGYYLIKTCEKSVLLYVNSTCGDGVCGGGEKRTTCVEDCGDCGDGICDLNEDLNCPDCAVCGDGICSSGEGRGTCLKDCVFCGDGICDYLEDRNSCRDDCESGVADGCCDGEADGICDPECGENEDPDCVPEVVYEPVEMDYPKVIDEDEDMALLVVVAMMVALALVGVAIVVSRMHKAYKGKPREIESEKPAPKKKRVRKKSKKKSKKKSSS